MYDLNVSHDIESDKLAASRGLINATPIGLILFGLVVGLLVWVL
jgi:hypothetical protein